MKESELFNKICWELEDYLGYSEARDCAQDITKLILTDINLLIEFKDKVIKYVEKCDESNIIGGRNYFINTINKWNNR